MKTNRYGKSSAALLMQKTSFFEENERHVNKQRKVAAIYVQQPKRERCKICDTKFEVEPDFVKDGIGYAVCDVCHHLNGIYEDTDEFCQSLYTADSGEEYAETYQVENLEWYEYRVASIYLPKAEFFYTSLLGCHIDPHELSYMDFGTGSGFMVSALKKLGLRSVTGWEVSKSQVDMGNEMLGENCLSDFKMVDTNKVLKETQSSVVSLIHVLEHLQRPREAIKELQENRRVKYLFLAVPTFSLSVYLEILSQDIFHRHLGMGHTHLFSENSLAHLCEEFGFEIISQWWFGTDIVDMYRQIAVRLEKIDASEKFRKQWRDHFVSVIDNMQLEADKKHFASEVHMVLKKV